jgi:hypothetical protein
VVLHLVDTRNKTILWGSLVPKRRSKSHYAISGFRKLGLHDTRGRRFTPFDFLSTEKPILPLIIHSTKNSGFRGSKIRYVRRQEILHLSLPGAETLNYQLLICTSISGFHPLEFHGLGIRDLQVQENTPLGISGAKTLKYPTYPHAFILGFRESGFWVLQV